MTLRKILEELSAKSALQMANPTIKEKGVYCKQQIDQAHQQILALIPKKKENQVMATDFRFCNRTPYFIQGFNEAISEMEQSMTGER